MTTTSNSSADTLATYESFIREAGGDGREAAVDVRNLAGDRARQIGEIKRGDVADLLARHVAPKRRVLFDEMQDLGEATDAGGGERFDRAGRDRIDTSTLRTQRRGEITDVGLEARFGQSHHVVIGERTNRAEIGERQQRRIAVLQQRA